MVPYYILKLPVESSVNTQLASQCAEQAAGVELRRSALTTFLFQNFQRHRFS